MVPNSPVFTSKIGFWAIRGKLEPGDEVDECAFSKLVTRRRQGAPKRDLAIHDTAAKCRGGPARSATLPRRGVGLPTGPVLPLLLDQHPNRPLSDFFGKLRSLRHGPILSRDGASSNPRAIHSTTRMGGHPGPVASLTAGKANFMSSHNS